MSVSAAQSVLFPSNAQFAIRAFLSTHTPLIRHVTKRDGRVVIFDTQRIVAAVQKAGEATGEFGHEQALRLGLKVVSFIEETFTERAPSVERVQDIVEEILLASRIARARAPISSTASNRAGAASWRPGPRPRSFASTLTNSTGRCAKTPTWPTPCRG